MGKGRVEAHGHRGARGLRPENTIPGFQHAMELGVDALELDVGFSRDGMVVLNHDQTLSPLTAADTDPAHPDDPLFPYVGRRIRDLSYAQIRTVDAGVRRLRPGQDADPFVLTQLPVPGARIPSLAEICALLQDVPEISPAVEIKTDPGWPEAEVAQFVTTVAEVLDAFRLTARARVLAFDWRVLTYAQRYAPDAGRVALVDRKTLREDTAWLAGLPPHDPAAAAVTLGATALSPHHRLITPDSVAAAHTLGLPVSAWTVNNPAEMSRFIEYGVDAIVTDYPDRLREVLAKHNLPLPAPRTPLLQP